MRETSEIVEKIGIERTFKKISEASVVLGMIDLTRDSESTCETVRSIISKVDFETQKLFILLNKTDISEANKNVSTLNFIVSELDNKGYNIFNETEPSLGFDSGSNLQKSHFSIKNNSDKSVEIIPISAKTGFGTNTLRGLLAATQHNLLADSDTTLVTNQRHAQALTNARTSLLRVREGLAAGLPTDLASQDIREAIYHLGSIVGEISTDEVLGNIFANFCIGK